MPVAGCTTDSRQPRSSYQSGRNQFQKKAEKVELQDAQTRPFVETFPTRWVHPILVGVETRQINVALPASTTTGTNSTSALVCVPVVVLPTPVRYASMFHLCGFNYSGGPAAVFLFILAGQDSNNALHCFFFSGSCTSTTGLLSAPIEKFAKLPPCPSHNEIPFLGAAPLSASDAPRLLSPDERWELDFLAALF